MNSTPKPTSLEQPPSSNTGAQNTEGAKSDLPEYPRRAILDWCAGTLPIEVSHVQELDEILRQLGLNWSEVRELDHGQNGYRRGITAGLARVYFDGNPGMGVHFVMPGKACREFEDHHGSGCWKGLHRAMQSLDGHFTRVDVAIDDHTDALQMGVIQNAPARSYWKKSQVIQGRDIATGENYGHTVYFGSRKSNAFVRFYDKASEQGVGYPWVRVELELKKTHADSVMAILGQGAEMGDVVAGILRHYLNFVEPNPEDSNRARWDVAAWWDSWLGEVSKLKLTSGDVIRKTIDDAISWLKHQVAPTFATVYHYFNGDSRLVERFVRQLIREGEPRMRERHLLMLAPS